MRKIARAMSITLSRRELNKGLLGLLVWLGAAPLSVTAVHAASCKTCSSSCGCDVNVVCCSPNGVYCASLRCIRTLGCVPGTRSVLTMCDDGSNARSCPQCFGN